MQNNKPWQINLFYIVTALFWASLYTYQPIMSPYLRSLNVNYTMIGLIGGAYGFTQMLLRIPLGLLSDKLHRRKIFICGGLLVSVVSSLILFFATDPVVILLGRGLAGAAASAWVVFTVLFSGYFERQKAASRLSFLTTCNNTGQVAAMLAGGAVAGWLGYTFPFLMGALLGAAGLVLSFFIKEQVPTQKKPPAIRELIGVVKNKNLMAMSLLAILAQMILFGTMNTFTPIVAAGLHASATEQGYLSAAGNIPRILSALLCGILLARNTDIRKLLAVSFILLAAGSSLTPFCPALWTLCLVSGVSGFGSGISMALLLSVCTRDIDEARRSSAMGFFQAVYGIGMFIGPVATGFFTENFGIVWGFMFSTAVALIGAVGSLLFIKNETH